jgi:uncharacterized heparinase superfamily protein
MAFADGERARARERIARLPIGSRLRAYEETYGLELGADGGGGGDRAAWRSPVAVEPYPASVRARRIAVAVRNGAEGLQEELARAARAVMLRPELHLLGNHVLENGLGLACAGAAAQGLEADAWWRAGRALLDWQLPQQFLADGGHVERSATYHLAILAGLLETTEIAEAAGRRVPESWRRIAARALGWVRAMTAPDGTYPLFNDAALDAAPTPAEVTSIAGAIDIEPASVAEEQRATGASVATLPATGWVLLAVDNAWLALDAGPDAGGWQPGHAHADGLTFELWIAGRRAVVDFGVASYVDDEARRETRATRSHNTVELAATDSCEVWGAFRVGRRGRGTVRSAEVRAGSARVEASHDGYARRPGRLPEHRRTLELRPGRLEIHDRIEGSGDRWVSRVRVDAAATVRVQAAGRRDVSARDDRWYPRHGDPRPARVYEQPGGPGVAEDVGWRLEW